ncbi:MAG TPA: CD3324 family protein [Clostridiaceae bacterium]
MKYIKVELILPENLVREIQKYIQGEYIYIPSQIDNRKKWVEASGIRTSIKSRNEDIRCKYISGYNIESLAKEFFLSVDSIRKIIYAKNK